MNLRTASEELTLRPASPTAAAEPPAIWLENVGVSYNAQQERIGSLKEYAIRLVQGRVQRKEFRALADISLTVQPGEIFGVVGHNGAGKSTLLKVISRVMRPTAGRVVVRGRIAPLLELGAGFHLELSGRENVFLNGTLLGYSHTQMEALFDEIVEFAELRDFIDAPLRTYSTGMVVRLGFAVATATRPDVLIVDEVLSVGDEDFQAKCAARIGTFRLQGTTILLVTHDSRLVTQMCDRALWLDHGKAQMIGPAAEVITAYQQHRGGVAELDEPLRAALPVPAANTPELETRALKQKWYYPFVLPSGQAVTCELPGEIQRIHTDRLHMVFQALQPVVGTAWAQTTCLDIGCNQGYFAANLAARGCQSVTGMDARPQNIADAELIRQIYALQNLQFTVADITRYTGAEQYDVVLFLSVLFWLEDPIGALRKARQLTRRVLLVETPVAPEINAEIDWGTYLAQKPLAGSFGLLEVGHESLLPVGSLTDLSLVPGRATLLWLMQRLGFSKVEVIAAPAGGYEQLVTSKRVMVAGYV